MKTAVLLIVLLFSISSRAQTTHIEIDPKIALLGDTLWITSQSPIQKAFISSILGDEQELDINSSQEENQYFWVVSGSQGIYTLVVRTTEDTFNTEIHILDPRKP